MVLKSFGELKSVRSFAPVPSKFPNPKGVITKETLRDVMRMDMGDLELERWKSRGVKVKWR